MKTLFTFMIVGVLQHHADGVPPIKHTGLGEYTTIEGGDSSSTAADAATDLPTCLQACVVAGPNCLSLVYCKTVTSTCPKCKLKLKTATEMKSTSDQSQVYILKDLTTLTYGQLCDPTVQDKVCIEHSVCMNDGSNSGTSRCLCGQGYQVFEGKCKAVIDSTIDGSCQTCESNDGVCIDTNFDDEKDGCHCKSTTSGTDCQKSHVGIECQPDLMKICYIPHSDVDFSKDYALFAKNYFDKSACRGTVMDGSDSDCPNGNTLEIKLTTGRGNEMCGLKRYSTALGQLTYQIDIDVTNNMGEGHFMKLSCTYMTTISQSSGPIVSRGVPGDEKGETIVPQLKFVIKNILDKEVSGVVRSGDLVYFDFQLKDDGIYVGMRAEYCLSSTHGELSHPDAKFLRLIEDGCPADNQKLFSADADINIPGETKFEMTTVPFEIQRFRDSEFVHYICTVRLCTQGTAANCAQKECSSGRKRRSLPDSIDELRKINDLEQNNVQIVRTKRATNGAFGHGTVSAAVKVNEPSNNGNEKFQDGATRENNIILNEMTIGLMIGGLALCILVAIACILVCRCMRRRNKDDQWVPENVPQPAQQFTLPRVNKSNMNI